MLRINESKKHSEHSNDFYELWKPKGRSRELWIVTVAIDQSAKKFRMKKKPDWNSDPEFGVAEQFVVKRSCGM